MAAMVSQDRLKTTTSWSSNERKFNLLFAPLINILRFLLERFSGLAIVYFLHCHHLSAFKLVEFVDLSLFADAIFFLRLFYHTSSCIPVISGVHEYSFCDYSCFHSRGLHKRSVSFSSLPHLSLCLRFEVSPSLVSSYHSQAVFGRPENVGLV